MHRQTTSEAASSVRRKLLKALLFVFAAFVLSLSICVGAWTWTLSPPEVARPEGAPLPAQAAPRIVASGVVVDEEGQPVEGVPVGTRRGDAGAFVYTDAEGRFALSLEDSANVRVLGAEAEPASKHVSFSVDDLRFTLVRRCPLELEIATAGRPGLTPKLSPVREAPPEEAQVRPVPGALVRIGAMGEDSDSDGPWAPLLSDAQGRVRLSAGPCDAWVVMVSAEGFDPLRMTSISPHTEATRILLSPGVLVDGVVSDAEGAPIEGARVDLEDTPTELDPVTDAEGHYEAWIEPLDGLEVRVTVDHPGYLSQTRTLRLAEDSAGVTLDFTLDEEAHVKVWCAGRPGESCEGLGRIYCTRPTLPVGRSCKGDAPKRCTCPGAPAAVRGGGEVARVAEGQDEVWLDFTGGGELRAEVVSEDAPSPCAVMMMRTPDHLLEDLGRGFFISREGRCDEEGLVNVGGLPPGSWRVFIVGPAGPRVFPQVSIRDGQTTDLGVIDLEDGGALRGQALAGLTEDPVPDAAVAAYLADEPMLRFPAGVDETDAEGRFKMEGLEPGVYEVRLLRAPFDPVEVEVRDGQTTELELWVGDDALAEDQGLAFVHGGAGELIIHELDPEGRAAEAGLQEGDVITGASFFGLDLDHLGEGAHEAVLAQYSGPGLSLQVEREGVSLEVDLE